MINIPLYPIYPRESAVFALDKKNCLIILFLAAQIWIVHISSAAEAYKSEATEPTVVAPGSLTERERQGLDKQYQFEVRRKNRLLASPAVSEPVRGPSASQGEQQSHLEEIPEEEKLHRYFGIAVKLYEEGRPEEAIDVLSYLRQKYPEDDHVKAYLAQIKRESKANKALWKKQDREEAYRLKRTRIEGLLKDGIDYYEDSNFDKALIQFNDVLALDPDNPTAKRYMDKLKAYYSSEMRSERIVENWVARRSGIGQGQGTPADLYGEDRDPQAGLKAENMLDKISGEESPADKLLNGQEIKDMAHAKKVEDLLEQVEFGTRVDAIVAEQKVDETKDQFDLGPGDVINITVSEHPELSGNATIRSNGTVVLPLTNDIVKASGLTVNKLAEKVTVILDRYIHNPQVTISVVSYRSQMFYVVDEVSCTPYPITKPDLTLYDALFLSDWGDNRALGRVIIIKPSKTHPVIRKVDTFDMIYRGNLRNNIRISNGDVIYVPMTMAAKTTKVIYDTIAPFRAARAARDEWLDDRWNQEGWFNLGRIPRTPVQQAELSAGGGGGGD